MTARERIYKAAKDAGLSVATAQYQRLTHGEAWPVSGGWSVWLTDGSGHLGWDADEVISSIKDHAEELIANTTAHLRAAKENT